MSTKTSRGGSAGQTRSHSQASKTRTRKPVQFNWRKHWEKKVKPHLNHPCVQFSLNLGMHLVEPKWAPGDPPYRVGIDGPNRAKKGTLAWYQPCRQCHEIAFFAMAIGVINYPKLRWKFVSGRCHTVPVGYDENGQTRVVMDILLFDSMTADASIQFALLKKHSAGRRLFAGFATKVVPAIRETLASKETVSDEPCREALLAYLSRWIKRTAAKSENATHTE
jgi:hypothetical protein